MDSLKKQLESLPTTPGVYLFKDPDGVVLYVGKSTNVRERIKSHLAADGEKTRAMVNAAVSIEAIPVTSDLESLLLEAKLIKQYLPKYNSAAKDDKHPLYIKITTSEMFPRIMTSRKDDTDDTFFGPFPSSRTVKKVLKQIRRVFPYHSGPFTKKPCLYSHIGLCIPCPGYISNVGDTEKQNELKKEYKRNIRQIIDLLSGKSSVLKKQLEKEMKSLSRLEDFEKAKEVRDQLARLEYITSPIQNPVNYVENPNLLEDLRTKELQELYKILEPYYKYLKLPKRIECYDNSHLQGKSATSSMVTFTDGEPNKTYYRQFKIRTTNTRDDFAMMHEVLSRRMKHLEDWGKPDLLVIDGGKGQVGEARKVLREMNVNIPVIGLAKRLEEIIVPRLRLSQDKKGRDLGYVIFRLPPGSPAINLLQRMRDEAHRFARRYHFKLRLNEFKK